MKMVFEVFCNMCSKEGFKECLGRVRNSRHTVLFLVFLSLLIDNLLLTTVVPIIPDYLFGIDQKEVKETIKSMNRTLICLKNRTSGQHHLFPHENSTLTLTQELLSKSIPLDIISENSKVGWLFSSRALVQIVTNPFIGPLSNRVGYSILMLSGCLIILLSSIIFAVGETFVPLLIARAIQGFGSACMAVSGMSMIAEKYPDDVERSRAMGIAMGGTAAGTLLGYPFGSIMYTFVGKTAPFLIISALTATEAGLLATVLRPSFHDKTARDGNSLPELLKDPLILIAAGSIMFSTMSMAVLEPTVPIWVMDTMNIEKWQLGLIFLPDSIGYLIGTNMFGVIAQKIGRWICAISCLIMIAFCLVCIPFALNLTHLILPHFGLGLGLGIIDAAIMPHLALLVDTRHVSVYGSVYAISQLGVCLGYALGPSIGGQVVKKIGFPWLMRGMAILNVVYSPLCCFLRPTHQTDETSAILSENGIPKYLDEDSLRDSSFSYNRLHEED
ncbi:synaptic vesicular amine transporter-like [Liolophura sinensis]|uniref:synaptic vesicular amine transporter-like n=1 Tax=Liolophura sinensis TaxID=3198878 RepID=UPI003158D898